MTVQAAGRALTGALLDNEATPDPDGRDLFLDFEVGYQKDLADALAGDLIAPTPFWKNNFTSTVEVQSVRALPSAALAIDAVNFDTLTVAKATAAGVAGNAIATWSNAAAAWVALTDAPFVMAAAYADRLVPPGSSITFQKAIAVLGTIVPACRISVHLRKV